MEKMTKLEYEQVQTPSEGINETIFTVKPLERGFGNTLGVALRRTLLSSITGLALFAVRIEGVDHEFQAIDGIKEDVVTLIMNLRKVKFQYDPTLVNDDDIIKVVLKSNDQEVVTSRNLEIVNSTIEILNKSQHIATINAKGKLYLEAYLRPGRGFISSEENKKLLNGNTALIAQLNSDIKDGLFIATDSNFSPVEKVNYYVNELNTSSPKLEEQLKMHLITDGTIEPKSAIQQACEILVSHFKVIGNVDEMKLNVFQDEPEIEEKEEENDIDINSLGLSVRSLNALKKINKNTLAEVAMMTYEELEGTKNLGKKSLDEIVSRLKEYGYELSKGEE